MNHPVYCPDAFFAVVHISLACRFIYYPQHAVVLRLLTGHKGNIVLLLRETFVIKIFVVYFVNNVF